MSAAAGTGASVSSGTLAGAAGGAAATTGTGTYTLSGAVFSGRTFAQGFPSGGTVGFFAQTADKSKWEFGYGTLTVGPPRTLTRSTILKSSNADSAIDWQADDVKYIFSIASADALAGLMVGNLATSRPWWVRQGGRWWDYAAGLAVSWKDYLYSGSANVRVGLFDAVKAIGAELKDLGMAHTEVRVAMADEFATDELLATPV